MVHELNKEFYITIKARNSALLLLSRIPAAKLTQEEEQGENKWRKKKNSGVKKSERSVTCFDRVDEAQNIIWAEAENSCCKKKKKIISNLNLSV